MGRGAVMKECACMGEEEWGIGDDMKARGGFA